MTGLGYAVDALAAWLAGSPQPGWFAVTLAVLLVWVAPVLVVVFPIAALGQIIERKVAAAIQRRYGPNTVGLEGPLRFAFRIALFFLPRAAQDRVFVGFCKLPVVRPLLSLMTRLGVGQLAADGVKMLGKEDIVPRGADGWVFRTAPYLALSGAFLPFCALPFAHHVVMLEVPVGALYVIAVSGITVLALLMAGWGSGNKFSLLGGMRAVAQLVSYEIPIGLAIAGVVLWSGTMDLHAIVGQQYRSGVFTCLGWNLVQSPFLATLAVVFFFAGLAECQRTPFDMAEAESELVSGFNTEYSGLRWGMFAMAEYTEMILIGALFATLFLGGYQSPIGEQWIVALHPLLATLLHFVVFVAKFVVALVLMVWIRWTLPRFRVDQVMRLCWLTLVPICLLCLFGLALQLVIAGTTEPGTAYGRLPALARPGISVLGHLAGWLVPVALLAVVVRAAKKKHGAVHPALVTLTTAARHPTGGGA
ncbi:MAG: NADH-quinone oxidoreductase subunit H [Planctomycetota bacterium]|nr:NADH-quinone oxidoreductase subunit H [Planctomycetota bacterium]